MGAKEGKETKGGTRLMDSSTDSGVRANGGREKARGKVGGLHRMQSSSSDSDTREGGRGKDEVQSGNSLEEESEISSDNAARVPGEDESKQEALQELSESEGKGHDAAVEQGRNEEDEEASALMDDRSEGEAPFYNGVRVKNLFLDQDTGAQQWCVGTIKYVKRSTREYRIYFDSVPFWEKGKKLYWPSEDPDMTVLEMQDHPGRAQTDEEKAAVTAEMLRAAKEQDWSFVKKAVWMRAFINAPDHEASGITALHYASLCGMPDIVAYLLEHGADPKQTDQSGNSPLHLAASAGCEETIKNLLRAGADVFARNFDDIQPIEWAQVFDHKSCENLLARYMQRALEKKHLSQGLSFSQEAMAKMASKDATQMRGDAKRKDINAKEMQDVMVE